MTSPDLIVRRVSRYFFGALRFVSGVCRSVYQPSRYAIKRGYIHRSHILPHDDRGWGEMFQKEVYQKAKALMEQHDWQSVIDVGCGSGYKLMKYLGHYKTLGIDTDPALSMAKTNYPDAKWMYVHEFDMASHSADLILCADVIEHVEHPDELIKALFSIPDWKCIMISTPERDIKRGWFHFGPPPNPAHWREWSKKELYRFVSGYHTVYFHEITNVEQATQLIICMNPDSKPL